MLLEHARLYNTDCIQAGTLAHYDGSLLGAAMSVVNAQFVSLSSIPKGLAEPKQRCHSNEVFNTKFTEMIIM